jgi:hypothetical protein
MTRGRKVALERFLSYNEMIAQDNPIKSQSTSLILSQKVTYGNCLFYVVK